MDSILDVPLGGFNSFSHCLRTRREMVRVMSSFIRGHAPHPGLATLAPGKPDSQQEFLSIGARSSVDRDYTTTFFRGYGRGSH